MIFAALIISSMISADETRKYTINVTVSGSNDYQKCPMEGNCSLEAAFQAVMNTRKFNSSTEIRITAGNYELNKSFAFYDFDGLALAGAFSANTADALPLIQCNGNSSGIAFYKCRNILIQSISLVSCGVLYNSSTYHKPLFYSAIFVENNEHFILRNVAIRESRGVGVTMYDTVGNVTIYKALFENNGPKNITCQTFVSKNSFQDGKTIAKAGGGLYIEFTYNQTEYVNNSHYRISQSNFTGNIAPFPNLHNETFLKPGGDKHIGFGRGGGLSLYFRGSAMNNVIRIDSCIFQDNYAVQGGGYFIQFLDTVQENQITIFNLTVRNNSACFGGGAFQLSAISRVGKLDNFVPNKLQSTLCLFSSNVAMSGGGGAIYGRSSIGYKNNNYYFNNCTWLRNEAVVGSALTLKLWDYGQGLFGPNSPFKVKLIDCNIVENTMRKTAMTSGVGALYDFLVPLLLRDVNFTRNTNTSLVIDTSSVTIMGYVAFTNNTGFKGGAVAMYGEASFNLTKDSNLTFKANIAKEKGGAIFVETPGPASIPIITSNYLRTHECFFKYEDSNTNPNNWQTKVNFIDNEAPLASGYSVFANSLKDCIFRGDKDIKIVLQWNTFHYYVTNSSRSTASNRSFEITTDAITISSNKTDWLVPPDQVFSPKVELLDEKNNSVYGMVHIKVIPAVDHSPVTLGTPSALFLVRDNIPFLDLKGIPATNFSINLRTAGAGQLVEENLGGLALAKCNPGFFQKDGECVCLSVKGYSGISRCSKDGKHVYLEKGYWGGEVISESKELDFATAQCPSGYCNCVIPTDETLLRSDECVYEASEMCKGNRIGVLCGSCRSGSVKVGDEDCSTECDNSDLWRLAPLLIFLTILVFVIFKINMDIFTCYLNAWLYFYQVINLVTSVHREVYLDPFIRFIIGLANITIDGPFASCLWKGMDNLTKLAFSYVLPVYVFLVVFVIGLVARKYPDSYFAKNSTFRASCTLFVLCYSALTGVSMEILRPSKIGNSIVVFHQGTVKYFSDYHTYFAVPAILILLFVVVPFPFILMFTPFFSKHVRFVIYATPLFNTFQACFKDGYRWFAAFYFFCRFFFLLFATFVPYGRAKASIIQVACVFVLSIHVYLCPYLPQYDWINKLDSLLLITLTAISIIAGQMTRHVLENERDVMMIIIDVLAYIPLVYTVALGFYLLYKWVKTKLHHANQAAGFENFNSEDEDDSETVKVI